MLKIRTLEDFEKYINKLKCIVTIFILTISKHRGFLRLMGIEVPSFLRNKSPSEL